MVHIYYWALAGLVSILVVERLVSYIRIARFKRAHGCKPVVRHPQSERIIGYGLYKEQINAARDKNVLEVTEQRFRSNGPTFSSCEFMVNYGWLIQY